MADERHEDSLGLDEPVDATTRRKFIKTTATVAAAVMVGCGGDEGGLDGSVPDTGVSDTGGSDTSAMDAGAADTSVPRDTATDTAPPPVDPPEMVPEASALFGLGVASGDVSHEDGVVWTRYSGTMPLVVTVWEMNGDVYERTVLDEAASPAAGGFVHVSVPGLSGGRRYRYVFFVMDGSARVERSAIGRFRAALGPEQMEDLVIGACSCTKNGRDFGTLERAGERDDLDAFLLLGDTTYNDDASNIDEHRALWAENLGTPGYRTTRAATSVLATWDDHEVRNNFDGEDTGLEDGRQAFFENLPLKRDAANPERMWKSIRWGATAEIFVLDCRGERLPSTRGTTDEYISRAQMDWLKAGLMASSAVFKIIVNSVPIADFPTAFDVARNDRWEGYPLQRTEILAHIDDNAIPGVLWVAGDFHLCSAQTVSPAGQPGGSQVEILAGPGGNTGNPATWLLRADRRFEFASTTNNYVTLTLLPRTNTIRVAWIDGDGIVFETQEYVY